ncbi:hypothetical protein DSO57_1018648 [Entomophthora muscae]|uniref:Uncharacterized protein n=1 Tax=Entomophthora muscae TaxID=34485 RepID=A0ACC2T4K5_9FUNG|nr:hypothetical protein DSO57_1018648 [Entomophthora muscae]
MPVPVSTPPSPAGASQYSWYPDNYFLATPKFQSVVFTRCQMGGTISGGCKGVLLATFYKTSESLRLRELNFFLVPTLPLKGRQKSGFGLGWSAQPYSFMGDLS